MVKNNFQYGGWNSYTLQYGTIMTLISPGGCTLQCGMWFWNRDSKFTKWQHPAMWYVAVGWHAIEFTKTSAILEFYIWFRFRLYHRSRHVILHQSPKFYPNRTTLMPCRFSKWRISAILDFRDPIFEKPDYIVVNRHHCSKLLSLWENRVFLHLGDRQSDKQTNDRWTAPMH